MNEYYFVNPKDALYYRDKIIDFLDDVRGQVSREFNIHYEFICGSVKCRMIAFTKRNNDGMCFDVDIFPDSKAAEEDYYASEIYKTISDAISYQSRRYGFSCVKRIRTIEIRDNYGFNCHFHIVYKCKVKKGYQKFIIYDSEKNSYIWIDYDKQNGDYLTKLRWIESNKLQDKLGKLYLRKLNNNAPNNRTTKDMYLEAVNDICNSSGFFRKDTPAVNDKAEKSSKKKIVHNFVYVSRNEALKVRKKLDEIIRLLHKELKNDFTFTTKPVGSSSRNMITRDTKGNTGYDFDVDIIPNPNAYKLKPKQIRDKIRKALDKYAVNYGFSFAGDSTSVITIKVKDQKSSSIKFSCDFAIVRRDDNGYKKFIRYNKKQNTYTWEYRGNGFDDVSEKYEWLESKGLKEKLKIKYLEMKNENTVEEKHSRSIFAEAVNNICHENGYKKRK